MGEAEQTTESARLTEAERVPLRYADRTIRNAHRIDPDTATLRIEAGDWDTVEGYVERLLRDRQRGWENAVLRECVEGMPATGDCADFMSVVSTAMLALRTPTTGREADDE